MMHKSHNQKPLVIFEMANNHMGDVDHGVTIIRAYSALKNKFIDDLNFAFKFQYRDLNTFIHPEHVGSDLKYIKRFEETRLSEAQWTTLVQETEACGFGKVCTPFDEISVDKVVEDGFDIIKIASCSFTDWPLLEKVSTAGKPVIASVAGNSDDDISNVAAFLSHRDVNFSLLYCVGMYPTPAEKLNVSMIQEMRGRYPHLNIGFSTHEDPKETTAVSVAVGAGARIFEKHVALPTEKYAKNLYSTDLAETEQWLQSLTHAIHVFGNPSARTKNLEEENLALKPLKRGAFLKADARANQTLSQDDLFLAIPAQENGLLANDLSKFHDITLKSEQTALSHLNYDVLDIRDSREKVIQIRNKIRQTIRDNHLVIPQKCQLEISHHFGLECFEETGLCMLTILNNPQYCKKLLFVLPGQHHPEQYHKIKHETFIVLVGEVILTLDGQEQTLNAGDVAVINPNQRHAFTTRTGAVIEEISTQSVPSDSYYTDDRINQTSKRKSYVELI